MMNCQSIIDKRKELWDEHKSIEKDREYIESVAEFMNEHEILRLEILRYPELLIEMFFVVVDKDQNTVPFFLNYVQRCLVNDLNQAIDDFNEGKRLHLNFLVVKGRQQGVTQFVTAYQLASAITKKNFSGITITDSGKNTNTVFENKAKFPFGKLPESIKPTQKFNNRRELRFDKLNSSWIVDTAGEKNTGRSNTLSFFHGSESAYWEHLGSILTGLGEALTKNSIKILESTGNGFNEYKEIWDGSGNKTKESDNTWEGLFYYWFDTPEYAENFESDESHNKFINKVNKNIGGSESEKEVLKKLKALINDVLTPKFGNDMAWKKAYWYFNKWRGKTDKELLKQEYPCNPREAFLASGRCVFSQDIITTRIEYLTQLYKEAPPIRGSFVFEWDDPTTYNKILDETIKFVPNKNGFITIYEDKQKGYPYVIGGDTKGEGRDKYAGTVLNNHTGNRCVTLHMQSSNSKPFTHQMYCLGRYFNNALIGIEINFNTAPIEELERLNYPNMYTRQKYDNFTKAYTKSYGWKTDGNTRPLIIDKEIHLIEDNIDLFNDITFLDECLTFVYDKNNRPDAQSGKHDDILISDMIANEIRPQQRFTIVEHDTAKVIKLIDRIKQNNQKISGFR